MIFTGVQQRRMLAVVAAGAAVMAGLAGANAAGLRFNETPSMPLGLWRVAGAHAPVRRGDIVAVCPPETDAVRVAAERGYIPTGHCAGGYKPLLKPVAATGGDVVAISAAGVAVNGQEVPATAQLALDSAGRPLKPVSVGSYRVAPGEIWLLSGYDPRSFDSRYFGPVPVANVQGIARPVWVLP
jgi:conjugative transfer signal peptidase TraF